MGVNVVATLVMLVAAIGTHDVRAGSIQSFIPSINENFPSNHLPAGKLIDLMKTHITISLKQLLSSKQFGSQYVEKPGLAKVLAEESDRHWNQGLDSLKEYLHIGGTIEDCFKRNFHFQGKGELSLDGSELASTEYRDMLKDIMIDSRNLVTMITKATKKANKAGGPKGTTTPVPPEGTTTTVPPEDKCKKTPEGDAEVARFLLDMVKEESEMAYKMACNAMTFNTIMNNGVAVDMFDRNL